MKRSLISTARKEIGLGAMLCLVLQLNACNAKSPSLHLSGKDGANAEVDSDDAVSGNGDSKADSTKAVATKPVTIPITDDSTDADETVSVPTVVTGSPIQENRKSNGDQVISNGRYFIKAAFSKKCLSLPNDSRENGVQFVQRTCDKSNGSMKFDVYISENGYFLIYNVGTSKVMEIRDQRPVMQAALQQGDPFFKDYQDFIIQERSDGFFHIRTRNSGMYVDLSGASTADGALVQLWNVGGGMSQAWIFDPTL